MGGGGLPGWESSVHLAVSTHCLPGETCRCVASYSASPKNNSKGGGLEISKVMFFKLKLHRSVQYRVLCT